MELSERKKKILASVIERYILTGEPVGSKVLCGSLAVSSATVRNEMAELSDTGYLEQPHTSAGRIPSHYGIKYYIDNLMARCCINELDKFSIDSKVGDTAGEPEEILSESVRILSEMTGFVAIATTPYDLNAYIKRVELVPLSNRTVMIVVLSSTGVIKSRICRCDVDVDISVAELFYNISAAHFIGHSANELTMASVQSLAVSLGDRMFSMAPLLVSMAELAHETYRSEVLIEGKSKLLGCKELEEDIYSILEALKNPGTVARLVNTGKDDLSVVIGRDNKNRAFDNTSVISSKYRIGGKPVGSIGIIGPVRMDYSRLIPNITYLSEYIGNILSEITEQ